MNLHPFRPAALQDAASASSRTFGSSRVPLALLFIFAVLGWSPGAGAQPRTREVRLPFFVDVVSFRADDGAPRTELIVEIPLTSLNFVQQGSGGRARVNITAIFYDKDGNQVTGDDWSYHDIPGSLRREENEGRTLNRHYEFRLAPGRYRVKVGVEEPTTGLDGVREGEIEVPDFEKDLVAASDLVFGLCGDLVLSAPADGFLGPVFPHPSRRYGEDTPVICVYLELYDPRENLSEGFSVRYRVRTEDGKTSEDTTFVAPRTGRATEVVLSPRFTGLSLGQYRLEVDVTRGGEKARQRGSFEIDESRISFIRDADKLRTVLGYIATNEELHLLEATPDDSLGVFWDGFWERRDPTPDTRKNTALIEFLRRVEYASRNFGVLEPGWRSDMGRIYIRYGAPDNIERILNDAYRPPTEVWYYYSRNLTFVFQDSDGFGRFRLTGTRRD